MRLYPPGLSAIAALFRYEYPQKTQEKIVDWTIKRGENIGQKGSLNETTASVSGFKRVLVGSIVTIEVLIFKNSKIFPFSPDFLLISKIYFFSRSEEHTSELQSHSDIVCRLLLEKKKKYKMTY